MQALSKSGLDLDADIKALYFLCWLDAVERLDTLLLEARHLQQNIIYLLRAPALYQALRYEEALLWKFDGWEIIANRDPSLSAEQIASFSILPYPKFGADPNEFQSEIAWPRALTVTQGNGTNDHAKWAKEITANLCETVNTMRVVWNTDQRAHYHNLCAVQELKRHIARDKVFLCREGLEAFLSPGQASPVKDIEANSAFSRFLVLRAAVLARARAYVERLADHLASFAYSQDYGMHDHPRPTVQRRRDQHMYSVHLRDRCRNIAIEMSLLLSDLSNRPYEGLPVVFHRWEEDFTSHSYSFEIEFSARDPSRQGSYQHYINTSYWMPERPDLQSVIAHEVAHTVLREELADLWYQTLDSRRDSFSRLLMQLKQCLDIFQAHDRADVSPLRELAVDLLATAIHGPAYVYALFLELIASGTEDMFAVRENPERFELEMINYLKGFAGDYAQIRDWYVRLHVVCVWLEKILPSEGHDDPRTVLAMRFTASSKLILDRLNEFLDENAPPGQKTGGYWRSLTQRLCIIVARSSAARKTKAWLRNRERDEYVRSPTESGWVKGRREFPRSTRKLHWKLRNFLVAGLEDKKLNLVREICDYGFSKLRDSVPPTTKEDIEEHVRRVYGLKADDLANTLKEGQTKERQPELHCASLFVRLHDLPWQCGLLRGLDFVHENSWLRPRDGIEWLWQMHSHAALGRELYQLALDFYVHDVESPWNRLSEAIRVVDHLLGLHDPSASVDKRRERRLKYWLGEKVREESLETLKREFVDSQPKDQSGISLAITHDARTLLSVSQKVDSWPASRKLQKVLGLKLEQLLCMLLVEEKPPWQWDPLVSFLQIRSTSGNLARFEQNGQNPLGEQREYHEHLLEVFSKQEHSQQNKTPLPAFMFSRMCTAGSYDKDPFQMSLKVSILPSDGKEDYWWDVKRPINRGTANPTVESFYTLLGRYDVLSIMETRPMSRSDIPSVRRGGQSCTEAIDPPQEKFPGFFMRREMVIPVRLGKADWTPREETRKVQAIISVALNRVATRLDFLTRLLEVSKDNYNEGHNADPKNLNALKGFFCPRDLAYLSDGWGDILLVFAEQPGRSLTEIFALQAVLYEDFQVERTELILTPQCVAEAALCKDEDIEKHKFRVWINARLMASRTLARDDKEFESESKASKLPPHLLMRIPGVMDYNLRIEPTKDKEKAGTLYRNMLDAVVQDRIDRFRTVIGIVESGGFPGAPAS